MARRTFFSFHYKPDVTRAHVVRNSWRTKPNRESAGFFDSSVFESKKRTGDDVLKAFLTKALKNTSVTCVLFGAETYLRKWVRYEIVRSFHCGNGILGIKIASIKDFNGRTTTQGPNPFSHLAFTVKDDRVHWKSKRNGSWNSYTMVPTMGLDDVAYDLGDKKNHTFATLFDVYSWRADDGYNNIGKWIEKAARQAGR